MAGGQKQGQAKQQYACKLQSGTDRRRWVGWVNRRNGSVLRLVLWSPRLREQGPWPWHGDQTKRGGERTAGTLQGIHFYLYMGTANRETSVQAFVTCRRISNEHPYTDICETRTLPSARHVNNLVEVTNRCPCVARHGSQCFLTASMLRRRTFGVYCCCLISFNRVQS